MTLSEFFGRFLFVRKCAACGELLPYEKEREAFCDTCRAKWDIEKTFECGVCGKAVCECICMPRELSGSGALCLHKAVKYSADNSSAHNAVMFLKRNKNPRTAGFLAAQMLSVLSADKELPTMEPENTIITFVPRSRNAVLRYGFDQARLLAEALSERTGIACEETVRRRRNGREQKKLNAAQRKRNVKHLFEPIANIDEAVSGKNIILIDDIVTTGASMAACVSYLVRARAGKIICLSVAAVYKDKS